MRKATTFLVQRWKDEGPASLKVLENWRTEDGWPETWLPHAEEALVGGEGELLALLEAQLSPSQVATLQLTKLRVSGEVGGLRDAIEYALTLARDPAERDLLLEGRLRMEMGLVKFEAGEIEAAREEFNWAETRLKSVAKASREHDLAILNKAAFHLMVDESLMALHTYAEIPRIGEHAPETVAFSRLGASRILAQHGLLNSAIRHAWVSHNIALECELDDLAWQAGTTFLMLAPDHMDEGAVPMDTQVEEALPRSLDAEDTEPAVQPAEVNTVFDRCTSLWDGNVAGEARGDLLGLMFSAFILERMDDVKHLFSQPEMVEDGMLMAAAIQLVSEEERGVWERRINEVMNLDEV